MPFAVLLSTDPEERHEALVSRSAAAAVASLYERDAVVFAARSLELGWNELGVRLRDLDGRPAAEVRDAVSVALENVNRARDRISSHLAEGGFSLVLRFLHAVRRLCTSAPPGAVVRVLA